MNRLKGISLFSGAGGMDVGFHQAGVDVILANEINKNACGTYKLNYPDTRLIEGDITEHINEIIKIKNVDVVFGGPPCQGFSVAGKMDPTDERSQFIWSFLEVVEKVQPRIFVMENVKALGKLEKWKEIRENFVKKAEDIGYYCEFIILNSADFGVTQNRERVFFFGSKKNIRLNEIETFLETKKKEPKSLRQLFKELPRIGSAGNEITCTAKITTAGNPILRKNPYAGNMFNGMGRPLNLEGLSSTLSASMGGNKTPIVNQKILDDETESDWILDYHSKLISKEIVPEYGLAPDYLRRLSIAEVALIQSFPLDYKFYGSKSTIYTQIGNAVPCKLAKVVAETAIAICL